MLARLWWKEYRAFGPVWLILVLAAGLLQWYFTSVNDEEARKGALTITAMAWAVLYAFAAGAAAFSGEREAKTLGFLDALPVGRGTLWLGKVSFVLVTTAVLAVVLAGMASLGTLERDPGQSYAYGTLVPLFGSILFEAVAWSLLWSSISGNTLLAGVLGVLSVYLSAAVMGVLLRLDEIRSMVDFSGRDALLERVVVAAGALAVSGLVMAWRPRFRKRTRPPEPAPRPIVIRSSSTGRSLVWQARREGGTTWLLVGLVALVVPPLIWIMGRSSEGLGDAILCVLGSLVAGVSVFGLENASGARRFLVQHGVAPGTAWTRKFLTWAIALGLIFGLSVLMVPSGGGGPIGFRVVYALALTNAFAVGLLSGMAITRRITAVLVGVIVLVAILPLQIGVTINAMAPVWGAFLVPTVLVVASRAWAADWLYEREGFPPWLRFGAWLVGPLAVLLGAYVSYRSYGIADVGRQFVGANLESPAISPAEDAALAYDRAAALIVGDGALFFQDRGTKAPTVDSVIENGWDPRLADVVAYWEKNRPAIEQARRASSLPRGRFEDIAKMTLFSGSGRSFVNEWALAQLLALDARERLSKNDLAGAWDDVLAQFRMAVQLAADSPPMFRMLRSTKVHRQAVALAFDWLATAGTAPEPINKALADLKALPPVPTAAATIQFESALIERTLDRFDEEIVERLSPGVGWGNRSTLGNLWFTWVVAAPWERQHARRVCRLAVSRSLPDAIIEPYRRGPNPELKSLFDTEVMDVWTLTRSLLPNFDGVITELNHEAVDRRALEQAVAIEAWRAGHDGKYPETLEVLVPGLLPSLPPDPFSGKPFGYTRSDGRPLLSLFRSDNLPGTGRLRALHGPVDQVGLDERAIRPGQPLLYSFGPNLADDKGNQFQESNPFTFGDYVFAIP